MSSSTNPYSPEFFESQVTGSAASAKEVIPALLKVLAATRIDSVVDIGCGTGVWLSEFKRRGVTEVLGIDGPYVNARTLRISDQEFMSLNVSEPFRLSKKYSIAISLEVGEHLPPETSGAFVSNIASTADVVFFSACPPTPRHGTGHQNERQQSFWAAEFKKLGMLPTVAHRAEIWQNESIEWFYRQNSVIYARRGIIEANKLSVATESELDVYHPAFVQMLIDESICTHTWKDLVGVVLNRAKKRVLNLR